MGLSLSTKHLCAGTYMDSQFAQRVLLNAYGDRSRYVAPSYGFDVAQVAYHARLAWWIDTLQHLLVVVATVVLAFSSLVSIVVAACALVVWHSVLELGRLANEFTRYLRDRRSLSELTHFRVKLWLVALRLGVTIAVLVVALIFALGMPALSSFWRAEDDRSSLVHIAATAGELLLLALGAVLLGALLRQAVLHQLLNRGPFGRLNSRMKRMHEEQHSRVTVYSGYRPFIGSGEEISTWSFALRLLSRETSGFQLNGQPAFERKQELLSINFGTEELVRRIREELTALAPAEGRPDDESELKLPGLVVTDRVFVGETDAVDIAPNVDDAVQQTRRDPTGPARHYLACTVNAWDGEVVTSVFVTASLQGKMLYLEFSVWALLPTRPDFHVSGKSGRSAVTWHANLTMRRLAKLPAELQRLPGDLLTLVPFARKTLFRLRSDGPRSYGRNRGTKFSVREDGAISRYVADVASLRPSDFIGRHRDVLLIEEADTAAERDALQAVREAERLVQQAARAVNYFQIHDIKRHWKILERRVLAAVLDFLEENGIDTAEYNSHVTQILNNGTIINGSVTAHQSHFGTGNVNIGSESKPANAKG